MSDVSHQVASRELEPLFWTQHCDGVLSDIIVRTYSNASELGRSDVDAIIVPGYGEKHRTTSRILNVCTDFDFSAVVVLPDDRDVPCEDLQISTLVHEFGRNSVDQLKGRGLVTGDRIPAVGHSLGGMVVAKTFSVAPEAIGDAQLLQPVGLDSSVRMLNAFNDTEERNARFRRDFYRILFSPAGGKPIDALVSAKEVTAQLMYDKFHRRFKRKFGVASDQDILDDVIAHAERGNYVDIALGDSDPICRTSQARRAIMLSNHFYQAPASWSKINYFQQPKGHTHMAWQRGQQMLAGAIARLQENK